MIFVDTGAWFALVVPTDPDHEAAVAWFDGNRDPVLTSDYVVDETLTLLRVRGERRRAVALGRRFFAGQIARVHHLSEADVMERGRYSSGFPTRIGALPTAPANSSPNASESRVPSRSTDISDNSDLSLSARNSDDRQILDRIRREAKNRGEVSVACLLSARRNRESAVESGNDGS